MRILHVFRSPVGGLFRHVCDLARGQHDLGHDVGMICDSGGGGEFANQAIDRVKGHFTLGVHRVPISRKPGLGDVSGSAFAFDIAKKLKPDVIHGHGAKGGLYGRSAGWRLGIASTYTPHYGSLAFEWSSPVGAAYLAAEVALRRMGSGICFVCNYERDLFDRKIGIGGKPHVTVLNGIWPEEFKSPVLAADATDFMSLCEIRSVKGIDLLIRAVAQMPQATLTVVGDGPDKAACETLAQQLGVSGRVRFPGARKLAEALTMGRIMVLPSHRESFPYAVVEAGAARKPLVATAVGGIPEIVPATLLCEAGNVDALRGKLAATLQGDPDAMTAQDRFFDTVRQRCCAVGMCKNITDFYGRIAA